MGEQTSSEQSNSPRFAVGPTMYCYTAEELYQLVFEAGGAATAPLMADHPDYVFPSEQVSGALRRLLEDEHYIPAPEGYRK